MTVDKDDIKIDITEVSYTIFKFIVRCPQCKHEASFGEEEFNDRCLAEVACEKCKHKFLATIANDTERRSYSPRLIKAVQYLRPKIRVGYYTVEDFWDELFILLKSRGMTDSDRNNLERKIIEALEPPGCTMTHCKDYGHSSAFCNCSLGRIPGRCGANRAYLKRIREREAKMKEYIGKRCKTPEGKVVIPVRIWSNRFDCEEIDNNYKIVTLPMGKLTIIEDHTT